MENEFEDIREEKEELKNTSVREILSGSLLTRGIILKNIYFIIWMTFLGIVYIGNSYHSEKVARYMTRLQSEVKELRAESITTASELMRLNRQSTVKQLVRSKKLDLKESEEPPYKLKN